MTGEREQPTLREMQNRTVNARLLVVNNILTIEVFTTEVALYLAHLYVSYAYELHLHNMDALHNEQQSTGGSPRPAEFQSAWRIEAEAALYGTLRGHYRGLKDYLREEGLASILSAETGEKVLKMTIGNTMRAHGITREKAEDINRRSIQHSRRFGEQLLTMVGVIPDEGDPLRPPPPAWEIEG